MPNYYSSTYTTAGDEAKKAADKAKKIDEKAEMIDYYKTAATNYEKHLALMEREAEKRPAISQTFEFNDAYAFYLMQIMHVSTLSTACLLTKLTGISPEAMIDEMQENAFFVNTSGNYAENFFIYYNKAKQLQKKQPSKINIGSAINLFRFMAKIADAYSDKFGQLADTKDWDIRQQITALSAAARAMKNAIILFEKFNPSESSLVYHLSLMMYLESLYLYTEDESYLKQLEKQLKFDHQMIHKTPEQKLELICYHLLVNTVLYRADDDTLIKKANELIEKYDIKGEPLDDFQQEKARFETERYRNMPPPLSFECFCGEENCDNVPSLGFQLSDDVSNSPSEERTQAASSSIFDAGLFFRPQVRVPAIREACRDSPAWGII